MRRRHFDLAIPVSAWGTILCASIAVGGCHVDPLQPAPLVVHDGDRLLVADVIKGDEIVVAKGRETARVRLLGVFSFVHVGEPDPVIDLERAANTFLRGKVMGKTVTLNFGREPKDPHGRYLAYVSMDGKDLNREMIREGLVLTYTEFGVEREPDYLAAEAQSRAERRRIWSKPEVAPIIRRLRHQWAQSRWDSLKTRPQDPLLANP